MPRETTIKLLAGVAATCALMSISQPPVLSSAPIESGSDYVDADSGSLGVYTEPTISTWCVIDAGSLGLIDPTGTCGQT